MNAVTDAMVEAAWADFEGRPFRVNEWYSREDFRSAIQAALAHTAEKGEAEPVGWETEAEWELEQRAFNWNAAWSEEKTRELINDLWRQYCLAADPAQRDDLVAEVERLRSAARKLIGSELATKIRSLVAGWNGEGVPEEYRFGRHPHSLGVKLPTDCGSIYMLDEVLGELRAALEGRTDA